MGATSFRVEGIRGLMRFLGVALKRGGGGRLRIFTRIKGIVLTLRDFSLKSGTIHNGTFNIFICLICGRNRRYYSFKKCLF